MTAGRQRPWRLLLRRFATEAAQPVEPDSGRTDYVPTQSVTEYLRHQLVDHDGSPIMGIRYRSAARRRGVLWVLFVDAHGCVEKGPGWENDAANWLGLDPTLLRRFHPSWAEEAG